MGRRATRYRRAAASVWLAMVGAISLVGPGCTGSDSQPAASPGNANGSGDARKVATATASSEPLRIAAASDLQAVLPRLAERFQARTGVSTSLVFGASGQLTEQIKAGAPFDVFMSANRAFVRQLVDARLINAGSARSYARGSLVLAVYRGVSTEISTLKDLAKPAVKKIALANPAIAPYGKAAKEVLERTSLWNELEPKIVIAESVRQALVYAQRGDAEAALIGRAIAGVPEIKTLEIDARLYDPIIQELGVVTASQRQEDARKFTDFILDAEGQGILREFGFSSVE